MALKDTLMERIFELIPAPEASEHVKDWSEDEREYYRNGQWMSFTERAATLDLMRRRKVAKAVTEAVMQELANLGPYERTRPDPKFAGPKYWKGVHDTETWIMSTLGIIIMDDEQEGVSRG